MFRIRMGAEGGDWKKTSRACSWRSERGSYRRRHNDSRPRRDYPAEDTPSARTTRAISNTGRVRGQGSSVPSHNHAVAQTVPCPVSYLHAMKTERPRRTAPLPLTLPPRHRPKRLRPRDRTPVAEGPVQCPLGTPGDHPTVPPPARCETRSIYPAAFGDSKASGGEWRERARGRELDRSRRFRRQGSVARPRLR